MALDEAGADPGFSFGGGGCKRLCAPMHITSAKSLTAGVQGPLNFFAGTAKIMLIPRFKKLSVKKFKGEVSPNNNVDWVSRNKFYKPNSKSLSRFG